MRQVFGSFGTAIFVTLLQSRQSFHSALLAQTATSSNFTLMHTLADVQQWVLAQGGTLAQAQAGGLLLAFKQLQLAAAVQGFDDVFVVASLVTLLALLPALFIGVRTTHAANGHAALAMD
jgi:hypothetical protein